MWPLDRQYHLAWNGNAVSGTAPIFQIILCVGNTFWTNNTVSGLWGWGLGVLGRDYDSLGLSFLPPSGSVTWWAGKARVPLSQATETATRAPVKHKNTLQEIALALTTRDIHTCCGEKSGIHFTRRKMDFSVTKNNISPWLTVILWIQV